MIEASLSDWIVTAATLIAIFYLFTITVNAIWKWAAQVWGTRRKSVCIDCANGVHEFPTTEPCVCPCHGRTT